MLTGRPPHGSILHIASAIALLSKPADVCSAQPRRPPGMTSRTPIIGCEGLSVANQHELQLKGWAPDIWDNTC